MLSPFSIRVVFFVGENDVVRVCFALGIGERRFESEISGFSADEMSEVASGEIKSRIAAPSGVCVYGVVLSAR